MSITTGATPVAHNLTNGADSALRQTNPSEGTLPSAAEGTAQPAKEDLLSTKYAAMARKEQVLRKRDLELKAREAEIEKRQKTYESDYVPRSKVGELLQQNPESLGLSWDQITQLVLNQPKPEDVAFQKLQAKIQSLEDNQSQVKTEIEQQQQRAYTQAVEQIRQDAKGLIESDPAYETIKEEDAAEAVVELIEKTYKEKGILLDTADAANQVEEFLLNRALKLARLSKVQAKLNPPPVEAPAPEKRTLAQAVKVQPQQTLTNAMQASSQPPKSARERRDRAIQAFLGQV